MARAKFTLVLAKVGDEPIDRDKVVDFLSRVLWRWFKCMTDFTHAPCYSKRELDAAVAVEREKCRMVCIRRAEHLAALGNVEQQREACSCATEIEWRSRASGGNG